MTSSKSCFAPETLKAYSILAMSSVIVWRVFSDGDYSSVLTFGSLIQCFGFYMLFIKVKYHKSVAGLSARTLELYIVVYMCRLSSTLFRVGYLPVDASGDWVYQAADVMSLFIAAMTFRCIRTSHRSTYQDAFDTLNLRVMVLPCTILAMCIRGDLNESIFFDTMWATAMNLETLALLPQLWMLMKKGGEVDGLTSHFVASVAAGRMCALSFWWHGYAELEVIDSKGNASNIAGKQLLLMHGLQVFVSLDFLLHYAVALVRNKRMVLPQPQGVCIAV
jgi:hypothetical protein